MANFKKLFKSKHPVIGAIHFMPSPGFKGFIDIETSLENALYDLKAFEEGGVDGIIIENNYDLPHKIEVGPETVAYMTYLGGEIKRASDLPIGVSVLWNDYKAAFSIAKAIDGKFIRIPVFVDDVITDFGKIYHIHKEATEYRKRLNAEKISIIADIQVKHSKMIDIKKTLKQSYTEAVQEGADGIIITGEWTGHPPTAETIREINKVAHKLPILIGSGVDNKNISSLANEAYGFIVSTSLKTGKRDINHRNIMKYEERIDIKRVKELMKIIKNPRDTKILNKFIT